MRPGRRRPAAAPRGRLRRARAERRSRLRRRLRGAGRRRRRGRRACARPAVRAATGQWTTRRPSTASRNASAPGRRALALYPLAGLRIIAGTHRGRRIAAPKGAHTRPTGDRVREALFNLVGPVDGASVLDLYAGSGALGLEALSRGARRCLFAETDAAACRVIRGNLEALGLTGGLVRPARRAGGAPRGTGGRATARAGAARPSLRALGRPRVAARVSCFRPSSPRPGWSWRRRMPVSSRRSHSTS